MNWLRFCPFFWQEFSHTLNEEWHARSNQIGVSGVRTKHFDLDIGIIRRRNHVSDKLLFHLCSYRTAKNLHVVVNNTSHPQSSNSSTPRQASDDPPPCGKDRSSCGRMYLVALLRRRGQCSFGLAKAAQMVGLVIQSTSAEIQMVFWQMNAMAGSRLCSLCRIWAAKD